ncbi:uncharacterized protein BDV17DRAFT_300704 [Aspergillus undulatus]|uniref:uncharacterized protein n=1 Tax=Aspergillus undulatus TaxID=1810928 RepID=UPI003CCE4681
MPVKNYGVWKGYASGYGIEPCQQDTKVPQLSLYFEEQDPSDLELHGISRRDGEVAGVRRAAINITSGDLYDSRLVYWVNYQIDQNAIVDELAGLKLGFSPINTGARGLGLDYINNSLFKCSSGRLLPHDIPGQFNDIIDVLQPDIERAIDEHAEVYVFGSRSDCMRDMHNIHMNQGNGMKFRAEDGVFQDGGLLFHFANSNEWLGIFLAFASQAVHTNEVSGHAISGVGWNDILRPDIIEDAVVIQEAYIHPTPPDPGGRRRSVTLSNRTNRAVQLRDWSIRNGAGDVQTLPKDALLRPRVDSPFELSDCRLSERGDTIMLLNEHGLKVDGVSYSSKQAGMDGPIVFAH